MRVWRAALLIGILAPAAAVAAPEMRGAAHSLVLPDGSVVPLPAGGRGFGPDGPDIAPPESAPELPHAEAPRAANPSPAPLPPPVSAAERRKAHIDELYDRLAKAKDTAEAGSIGMMIADVLMRSGSDTADLLMRRAVQAMDTRNFDTATSLLDKVIVLRPHWAEAWNKRATLRYLTDDDVGSMADISQVLALEPRHFGALSGMGLILHRNGQDKAALTVLRRAAAINPQDSQVKSLVDELTPEVEGSEL